VAAMAADCRGPLTGHAGSRGRGTSAPDVRGLGTALASSHCNVRRGRRMLCAGLAAAPVVASSLGVAGDPAQAASARDSAGQLRVLSPQPGMVVVAASAADARALRLQASLRAAGAGPGLAPGPAGG
jgi:hypothetical protein